MSGKPKKEGKHSPPQKDTPKAPTFQFFNETGTKYIRRRLTKELNVVAKDFKADKIDLKTNPDYPKNFNDRDWSWRPCFFMRYLEYYESTRDYEGYPFHRIWLDHLINQCGVMIWNLVHKTYRDEYKKTGIIPANPLSRKQGRNNIEAVAEHFANIVEENFKGNFK